MKNGWYLIAILLLVASVLHYINKTEHDRVANAIKNSYKHNYFQLRDELEFNKEILLTVDTNNADVIKHIKFLELKEDSLIEVIIQTNYQH